MHPFFEGLSQRQSMLLLTTLTVGGSAKVALFDRLPERERALMHEKANGLLAIDGDKRVAFMVKQMKAALSLKGLRGMEYIDPSWLLAELRGESPRILAAIMMTLPATQVRSLLRRLPDEVKRALPAKSELRAMPEGLLHHVRQNFELRFWPMPQPVSGRLSFRDLVHLSRRDLRTVALGLGHVELGQAFASVGQSALVKLCRKLPKERAEALIAAVRTAVEGASEPELKCSRRFLSRTDTSFSQPEELFFKGGLWRLARASVCCERALRFAFGQRLPREVGLSYLGLVDDAEDMEENTPELVAILHTCITDLVRKLSSDGQIDGQWAEIPEQSGDENPLPEVSGT